MKRLDMDRSHFTSLTLCCVSAVIAGLVPATHAQVADMESAPKNVFDTKREESLAKFLEAGPISIRPHLDYTAFYDSNISLTPNREQEDFVFRLSPGALFGIGEFRGAEKGNYLSLDYTATGSLYNKYSSFNSLDHDVAFNAGWKASKLTLSLGQSYELSNGKQGEISAFVEQESYVTTVGADYELSEKTAFELNGRQSLVNSEVRPASGNRRPLNTINQWEVEAWGDHKATEKLTVGVGAIVGWRDIVGHRDGTNAAPSTPNQTFQQVRVRAAYEVSEKVDVHGSLGAQFTQFEDKGGTEGDDRGPVLVFDLGGSWQPMEETYLTLDVYRRDVPSYSVGGANYDVTGIRAAIRKVIQEKYSASLAAGYENSNYSSGVDREDNYTWIRPGLDFQVSERIAIGVFYQFRTKSSDQTADQFDYKNHQIGILGSYHF